MKPFKFIHAADIHLDSPLSGLDRYEGAPVERIRGATRESLIHLVDLAIEEEVQFVIIAGDLYDGKQDDYHTILFFNKQMGRLNEKKIPVYLISGNHDAESVLTKKLRLPQNVFTFSTRKPESKEIEELQVILHGQGFQTKSVQENLSLGYPMAKEGWFNIGILHTNVAGNIAHDNYAPCSLEDLLSKDYHYWALGHIHQRAVLHEEPWIVYPGNIQGRHIREQGAKGCTLVHVDTYQKVTLEERILDVVRWKEFTLDCSPFNHIEEAYSALEEQLLSIEEHAEGRLTVVRLILSGKTKLHEELNRNTTLSALNVISVVVSRFPDSIWLGEVFIETGPAVDYNKRLEEDHPLLTIATIAKQIIQSKVEIQAITEELMDLRRRLGKWQPLDRGKVDRGEELFGDIWVQKRLKEAAEILLPREILEQEMENEAEENP